MDGSTVKYESRNVAGSAARTVPLSGPVVLLAWFIAIGFHVVGLVLAYQYVIPFSSADDDGESTIHIELIGDPFSSGAGKPGLLDSGSKPSTSVSGSANPMGSTNDPLAIPAPAGIDALAPPEGIGASDSSTVAGGGSATSGPSIVAAPAGSMSDVPLVGIGSGGAAGGDGPGVGKGGGFFGIPGTVGTGDGVRGARRIVFVVDRSGSMADTFEFVRKELRRSVTALRQSQRFHVIFFSSGEPVENPPERCVPAIESNKQDFFQFLDRIVARGGTQPEQAMRRAIELEPELIYMLTDGMFSSELVTNLRTWNAGGKIKISTIAYVSDDGRGLLEQIAREHGGEFKFISEHDLP